MTNPSLTDVYRGAHRFLVRLFGGSAPRIGLEISDQAVRILYERKGKWELEQVPLPPGTVEKGRVMNAPVLLQALVELRKRASGGDARRIGVHVSLTSAPVYTQLVTIPPVSNAEMAAAVELNIQVSAPVALNELAWGWQPLPAMNPPAVLAAWTARDLADQLVAVLADASFLPASLEPKVLSLGRLVRDLFPGGGESSYLLASVDEMGITLAVLDAGTIRFQYSRTWDEIRGVSQEITYATLEGVIRREVPQVVGFYAQRAGSRLGEVLLATPTFGEEMARTLSELGFVVRRLEVGTPPFPLQGYAAFGAALRGNVFSTTDQPDLSLLGGQVLEWLRKELVVRTAKFWTLVAPLSLAILLITYVSAYAFVARIRESVTVSKGAASAALLAELADSESKATRFNQTVASIAQIQATTQPKSPQLQNLLRKASQSGVTLTRISLGDAGGKALVSGLAGSEDQLLSFKRSLEGDQSLSGVTLPIAEIRSGPEGITFSISFVASFAPSGKASL